MLPRVWFALVIVLLAALALLAQRGIGVETNLLSLLPSFGKEPLLQKTVERFAEQVNPRLIFLVGHKNPEQARTAASRYHVYPLLMGRKKRWIEAPDAELKMIQRRLLDRVLYELEPTTWAHGFTKGKSIVSNAEQHCGRQWVVSLDIF